MKVFVAGATGAIGRPLVRQLLEAGHDVSAITRSEERALRLRSEGIDAHIGDALDRDRVGEILRATRPEVLVHQLTTFPTTTRPVRTVREWRQTVRLRIEGSKLFAALGKELGVRRIVAQSIAFGYKPLAEPRMVVETDPFYGRGSRAMDLFMRHLLRVEDIVTSIDGVEGVALRYGGWYGPGTHFALGEAGHRLAIKRRLPLVAGARGAWNAIQVEDAASATVAALSGPTGVYNVVDDEPTSWNQVVSSYCARIDAPPPRTVPKSTLAFMGFYTRHLLLHQMPVSNEKAKRDFDWKLRYPTFESGLDTLVVGRNAANASRA